MFAPLPIALPIVVAFVVNMAAELLLLYSENRIFVALGKSIKATVIPALIATYALIIANMIAGANA